MNIFEMLDIFLILLNFPLSGHVYDNLSLKHAKFCKCMDNASNLTSAYYIQFIKHKK